MAKLYFRHGPVSASKTANLLMVADNYKRQNKKCIVAKPKIDTRYAESLVASRTGLNRNAEIVVDTNTNIYKVVSSSFSTVDCLLVDEVQFLTREHIVQLREIATFLNIPVICYGLRTTYQAKLFPACEQLFALADAIEEIKTTCFYCAKKAILNMKLSGGVPTNKGDDKPDLGFEEKYIPTCYRHYHEQLGLTLDQ